MVAIMLVVIVSSTVLMAVHLVPGDPAEMLLSQGGAAAPPEAVAELRNRLGLDRPLAEQYLDGLARLARGDLGTSLMDDTPVAEEIWRRLPRTLQLMLAATLIAVAVGLPAGAVAALRAGGWVDRVFSAFAGLALGMPVFVAATVMVLVFSQQLRWAPAGGYVSFAEDPVQHLVVLMMPAIAASLHLAAAVFRMARSAVLDTLGQDFVRALRAKGLGEWTILFRHVVRNALIPVVTVVGLQMGTMLGGTVLIEYVFNWPGLSGFLLEGVLGRDYPVVVGVVVVVSILFVTINLIVDLLYAVIDPRARHS